jgi:hypothetical protein
MRLHTGNSIDPRPRAHTARRGLVVSKGFPRTRVNSSDGQVAHGAAGTGSRNTRRNRLGQCAQQYVYNALRGLHVASGYRGRRHRIDDSASLRIESERAQDSRRGRCVFIEKATQNIKACRERDSTNCIHATRNLGRGVGKVHVHFAGFRVEVQSHCDFHRSIRNAIVVQPVFGAEVTGRHGAQLRTHQSLGVI